MFGFNFRQRKPSSAQTAKERLQILLAHERTSNSGPDFLPLLQRDILEVVRRHMYVDPDAVHIKRERSNDLSSLEINIERPGTRKAS